MILVDQWKKISHSNLVSLREVFTTKAFGDNCELLTRSLNFSIFSCTRTSVSSNEPIRKQSTRLLARAAEGNALILDFHWLKICGAKINSHHSEMRSCRKFASTIFFNCYTKINTLLLKADQL